MKHSKRNRHAGLAVSCVALALAAGAQHADAQSAWKPEKPVEIIVNTAPGSGPDKIGRLMQKILQDQRTPESGMVVVNKPGAGGAVAYTYLNQYAGNGHYLAVASKTLLTTHVMGRSPITYTDVTPVAHLMDEYIGVAVRADSPIRSGKDLVERLKKDPNAHTFGIATSLGNTNHQAVAAALKASGLDVRKLKNVIFQSGGKAITAMLGGHVDVVPVSIGSWASHLDAGSVRVIAVSAPKRLGGRFANVPTWKEQGADFVVSNWRCMVGPKNMGASQVAYWESAVQRMMSSDEWQKDVARTSAVSEYQGGAATRKFMESDYASIKAFLADLELAR